jgi:hypothetical protein
MALFLQGYKGPVMGIASGLDAGGSMNFDELWRRNLDQKTVVPSANEHPPKKKVTVIDRQTDSVTKDPDDSEVKRYLDWLENSL